MTTTRRRRQLQLHEGIGWLVQAENQLDRAQSNCSARIAERECLAAIAALRLAATKLRLRADTLAIKLSRYRFDDWIMARIRMPR